MRRFDIDRLCSSSSTVSGFYEALVCASGRHGVVKFSFHYFLAMECETAIATFTLAYVEGQKASYAASWCEQWATLVSASCLQPEYSLSMQLLM